MTINFPTKGQNTYAITLMNVLGTLDNLNGMTNHSYAYFCLKVCHPFISLVDMNLMIPTLKINL